MDLDSLLYGIGRRETGGQQDPYGTVVRAGGGRMALGKYQILNVNVPAWTKEALGRPLTVQQFLSDPAAQDATARFKLGQYVEQFGPTGAAEAWLGGPGAVGKTRRDRFGTSTGGYAADVLRYAANAPQASTDTAPETTTAVPQQSPAAKIISGLVNGPQEQAATAPTQPLSPAAQIIKGLIALPAPAPKAAAPTPTAPNPFDQFDSSTAPPAAPNPFDQFDARPTAPAPAAPAPTPQVAPTPSAANVAIGHALFNLPNLGVAAVGSGFGLGHMLAPGIFPGFNSILHDLNQQDAATEAAHPVATTLGTIGGALLPGPEEAKAASAAAQAAPAGFSLLRTLGTQAGLGALFGGLAGFGENASPSEGVKGAIAGAVTGPIVGSVLAPAVGATARFAASRVSQAIRPAEAALDILSEKTVKAGESVADAKARLEAAFDRFKATFGRPPSVKELLTLADAQGGETTARDLASIASRSAEASQIARNQADAAAVARQGEVQKAVTSGQTIPSVPERNAQNKAIMDATMGRLRSRTVPIDDDTAEHLLGTVLPAAGSLGKLADRQIHQEIENGYLSIGSIEMLRQRFAQRASSAANVAPAIDKGLRDEMAALGSSVPGYQKALQAYGQRAQRATGQATGANVVGSEATSPDFIGTFKTARPDEQAGYPAGIREGVAAQAGTPGGASRIAQRLATDSGLNQRIAATAGPTEAARLQNIGQQASRAERGVSAATPRAMSQEEESSRSAGETLRTGLTAVHGASTATWAHVAHNLFTRLKISKGVAKRLTEMAGDPRQTEAVIQYMVKKGATPSQAARLRSAIHTLLAAQTGRTAAGVVTP